MTCYRRAIHYLALHILFNLRLTLCKLAFPLQDKINQCIKSQIQFGIWPSYALVLPPTSSSLSRLQCHCLYPCVVLVWNSSFHYFRAPKNPETYFSSRCQNFWQAGASWLSHGNSQILISPYFNYWLAYIQVLSIIMEAARHSWFQTLYFFPFLN